MSPYLTVNVYDRYADSDEFWASAAVKLKLHEPLALGFPDKRPVDGSSNKPAGSKPPVRDQTYLPEPPDAINS